MVTLKGFVSINPRWSGFKVEDYITISESVYENDDNIEEDIQIKAQSQIFSSFEIARSGFLIQLTDCIGISNR